MAHFVRDEVIHQFHTGKLVRVAIYKIGNVSQADTDARTIAYGEVERVVKLLVFPADVTRDEIELSVAQSHCDALRIEILE